MNCGKRKFLYWMSFLFIIIHQIVSILEFILIIFFFYLHSICSYFQQEAFHYFFFVLSFGFHDLSSVFSFSFYGNVFLLNFFSVCSQVFCGYHFDRLLSDLVTYSISEFFLFFSRNRWLWFWGITLRLFSFQHSYSA